jgi:hypothetical protein
MRIRIVHEPSVAGIDGIRFDYFRLGEEYEVASSIGSVFLAEGWAELVLVATPAAPRPFADFEEPSERQARPSRPQRTVIKEHTLPFLDQEVAADAEWRRRPRRKP